MFHYRMKVDKVWREIDLRPISEVPEHILRQATVEGLMWDVFGWGLMDIRMLDVLDQAPMRMVKTLYREWQQDSQVRVMQILELIKLADDHGGALEADLIEKGMRLRDFPSPRHTWRDLLVFVTYAGVHSNTFAATKPKEAGWGRTEQLLAGMSDHLAWIQWSKTEAAYEGGEPPDLIPRPGIKPRAIRPGSRCKPAPISKIRQRAKLDEPQDKTPQENLARQRQLEGLFR